jgi:hypothetical protein
MSTFIDNLEHLLQYTPDKIFHIGCSAGPNKQCLPLSFNAAQKVEQIVLLYKLQFFPDEIIFWQYSFFINGHSITDKLHKRLAVIWVNRGKIFGLENREQTGQDMNDDISSPFYLFFFEELMVLLLLHSSWECCCGPCPPSQTHPGNCAPISTRPRSPEKPILRVIYVVFALPP